MIEEESKEQLQAKSKIPDADMKRLSDVVPMHNEQEIVDKLMQNPDPSSQSQLSNDEPKLSKKQGEEPAKLSTSSGKAVHADQLDKLVKSEVQQNALEAEEQDQADRYYQELLCRTFTGDVTR